MHIPIFAGRAFTSADFAAAIATNAAEQATGAAGRKNSAASTPALAASYVSAQQAYSQSAPVPVIINETFAKKFFPKQNPLGMHIGDDPSENVWFPESGGPGYTIVGIAGDTKYARPRTDVGPLMFLPLVSNSAYFELRTAANPTALVKSRPRSRLPQAGRQFAAHATFALRPNRSRRMLFRGAPARRASPEFLRGGGAGAGLRRPLRPALLRSGAAHARTRHPHGPRCAAARPCCAWSSAREFCWCSSARPSASPAALGVTRFMSSDALRNSRGRSA